MSQNSPQSAASASTPAWLGQEFCHAPLGKLTTWNIGGPAERLYYPTSLLDLSIYLKSLSSNEPNHNSNANPFPITWLGLGSNVLIRDGGIDGIVIATKNLNALKFIEPNYVYAQAGVTCAKLARFCSKHNLQGAEFFAGIPGTVGGALAMNAGSFGGETWPLVHQLETISSDGEIKLRTSSEFDISYRTVIPKQPSQKSEGFVGAIFHCSLHSETPESLPGQDKIKQLLQERNAKQPIGTRNCGSVFRNPPGFYAAQLIEACNLKGFRIGDALVSPKHANFIINDNEATSLDIEQLIHLIQTRVLDQFSIHLVTEVKILGKNL